MFHTSNTEIETSSPPNSVTLDAAENLPPFSNASLLFQGDYARAGSDLIINHQHHGTLRLTSYFDQEHPPDLVTTNGAFLDGNTVEQLAGPLAPAQYTQAGTGLASTPIGTVQSATGTATVLRTNGTTETLTNGAPVFQGDVVQTANGSSLAIIFVDETLFSLSADARMVLDELIYSPGGSDNSMVMNLVQGSFVFVTGQVAPTGDMRVETPTATMGIRGTTPVIQINALDGSTRFSLAVDPDGTVGSYQLFDRLSGQLLGTVSSTDELLLISALGASAVVTPKTQSDIDAEQAAIQRAFDAYQASGLGQSNSNNGGNAPPPDAGPGQTDAGPPEGTAPPPINPLGPNNGNGPQGDQGPGGPGGQQGLNLLGPGNPPQPGQPPNSNGPQQPPPQGPNEPSGGPQTTGAPTVIVPPGEIVATEDGAITISGLNIDIPSGGTGSVTIVASSTVTLAQITGLTFVTGDGFDDETVSFIGTEAAINAALSGMIYTPTPDSETGGLEITLFDGTTFSITSIPITIQPVPDPPTVFDISLTVDENGSITAPFLGYDPDSGDTLTLNVLSEPEIGALQVHSDGTFTFDTNGDFDSLSASQTQDITFQYNAIDSTGLVSENTALITVTVTGVNDAPTLADASLSATEDGPPVTLALAPLGDDPDSEDTGATLTYAVTNQPGEGTAAVSGTTLTFTPGSDFQDLAAGETREVEIDLSATDAQGLNASGKVTVTVTGVNDDPILADGALSATEDGAPVSIDLSFLGDDPDSDDSGGSLVYSLTGELSEGAASLSGNTLVFAPGTDFQDLEAGETRDVEINISATDAHETTTNGKVTVTVTGVDEPLEPNEDLLEGFEDGLPESSLGNVAISSTATEGAHSARLSTSGQTSEFSNVAQLLDVTTQSLNALENGTSNGGSGLTQSFNFESPGVLSVDYRFSTDDYLPYNDYAVATFDGSIEELSDVQTLGGESDGQTETTGWVTHTFDVTEAGSNGLGFAVFDVGDNAVDSWLEVDNIRFTPALAMTYEPVADNPNQSVRLPIALDFQPEEAPLAADLGAPQLVTYSFETPPGFPTGSLEYSINQKAAAIEALSRWSDVSDLTVAAADAGEQATISFVNAASVAYAETQFKDAVSVVVTNPDFDETLDPTAGSYGFLTLLHETGHALGLHHPHDGMTHAHSVMSLEAPYTLGVDWWNEAGVWINPQTPMIADITAVQQAFGSNDMTRPGNDIYGFNSTETGSVFDFSQNPDPVLTIYDADGVDALDLSGWDTPALINLNPGSYSSVNGMTNNVGLALGTRIEAAIGGAGDDTLIGTEHSETLDGGTGRDTLTGGLGADTFVLAHDDVADIIVDFETGIDRLDLHALLEANFGTDAMGDMVQAVQDSGDTIIRVNRDGSGSNDQFRDVAVLQGFEAGGIIDFVFSDNGVQVTDAIVA